MGLHEHRPFTTAAQPGRSTTAATGSAIDMEAENHRPVFDWALLMVGLGGIASALWAMVLGWFALHLAYGLSSWLWS